MARNRVFQSRLLLVSAGLLLGYLARLMLGPPAEETENQRTLKPIPENFAIPQDEAPIDLPLDVDQRRKNSASPTPELGGLIAPFQSNAVAASFYPTTPSGFLAHATEFDHDSTASFEAHGEQLCASGCAASRHPTEELTTTRFHQLLNEALIEPMDSTNNAVEELLYYGRQTREMIEAFGFGPLTPARSAKLWNELQFTHARVSIRLVDERGEIRSWLEPTLVPFDRRHVFEMQTAQLQPLVTSGTVKRVGMKHLWVRL